MTRKKNEPPFPLTADEIAMLRHALEHGTEEASLCAANILGALVWPAPGEDWTKGETGEDETETDADTDDRLH